jgi:hypothetical protein
MMNYENSIQLKNWWATPVTFFLPQRVREREMRATNVIATFGL